MVRAVRAQRTARVSLDISPANSDESTSLSGTVDHDETGLQSELSGMVRGQPVRVIVTGSTMYVSGLTELPAGKVWQRSAVGARRPFLSSWTVLDQAVSSLTQATDERLLDGLRFNGGPPEDLDGTSVRGSLVTVGRDLFVEKLPTTQQRGYDEHFEGFDGARLQFWLDEQSLPRRLIVTLTGPRAYPTVVVRYSAWGSAVSINAPAASQVMDAPAA